MLATGFLRNAAWLREDQYLIAGRTQFRCVVQLICELVYRLLEAPERQRVGS
jgi:hypothetical protein